MLELALAAQCQTLCLLCYAILAHYIITIIAHILFVIMPQKGTCTSTCSDRLPQQA